MSPNSDFLAEEAPKERRERRASKPPRSCADLETCAAAQTQGMTRRDFLGSVAAATGMLVAPWPGLAAAQTQVVLEPDERQRIEAAIPTNAFVPPRRHRKLLIFDLNVGYGGHSSIPTANLAFTLMGAKTGAFETVTSRDPSIFEPENLKRFDAVFLNNTVGNLFEDPGLRQSLVEFVYGGGGLLGVHGTSVAFTRWPGAYEDWPEFGIMLGARGANHRESDEHIFIKLDDPSHPLNRPFGGKGFEYRDEFFRVHEPYSRHRVRVLLIIDIEKTGINQGPALGNCFRKDGDYALAWVRQYGRGRVFYSTIAHNPYVFWDPKMLQFYLAAVQFALGDLPAPMTPSGKLTPAVRAQEQLGWRLGLTPLAPQTTSGDFNLFNAIDKTAELGLSYIGAWNLQPVSRDIHKNFDGQLSSDELRQVRLKLDTAGVRLLTYCIHPVPSDEANWRKVFEFGRKMGIETFIAEPPPDVLDTIERLCDEYEINLAIPNRDEKTSPHYWRPQEFLKVCRGRSKRIGACGNIASWMRSGIEPLEAVRILRDRLVILQVHDLNELTMKGHDVPWGTGAGKIGPLLEEIRRLGLNPIMFGIEYPQDGSGLMPEIIQSIEFFNKVSVQLAK